MTAMYTLKRGGAYERFVMAMEALLERGCQVYCLSLTPISIHHHSFHNHVIPCPTRIKKGLLAKGAVLILFPLYLLAVGCREKVDLIVAFTPLYGFLQAITKWVLRIPMVTFIRLELSLVSKARYGSRVAAFLDKGIEYVALSSSDRLIAVNTMIRDQILDVLGGKKEIDIRVLFNNIPAMEKGPAEIASGTRVKFGIPANAKMLVSAGVLTPRKNFELLVRSLRVLEKQDVYLVIIGDSTNEADFHYRESLLQLIKKLHLSERVKLTGWIEREELRKLFSTADLFVLASVREGMPNVLLEALGLDVPCFGSNVPGIIDVLSYEELMFDPSDEESFVGKVRHFFSDCHLHEKVRALCRERKGDFIFDWKKRASEVVVSGWAVR